MELEWYNSCNIWGKGKLRERRRNEGEGRGRDLT